MAQHPAFPIFRALARLARRALGLCLGLAWVLGPPPAAWAGKANGKAEAGQATSKRAGKLDHSGKRQRGKASYYSRKFAGKKMADGNRMNPSADVAASKTLPLGTKARVKNLETGKSTVVDIKDRGPYVKDRIIDLSPSTAKKLDMGKGGVAPVEVAPIEVPQPDGSVKPGAAATEKPAERR